MEAQFLRASPAFYTYRLRSFASSEWSGNDAVVVTQTQDDKSNTTFWVTRYAENYRVFPETG